MQFAKLVVCAIMQCWMEASFLQLIYAPNVMNKCVTLHNITFILNYPLCLSNHSVLYKYVCAVAHPISQQVLIYLRKNTCAYKSNLYQIFLYIYFLYIHLLMPAKSVAMHYLL